MTLFTQLTPEAEALIQKYPDLINENLGAWIKAEISSRDSDLSVNVVAYLTEAKKKKNPKLGVVSCTPLRKRLIEKLAKSGHGIKQFKGVIDFMIVKFWDTEFQSNMITPEYMFRPDNFQKYLEEARDHYRENRPRDEISDKKKHEHLIDN